VKAIKVISDPEAFQLMADDTRRRLIHLLRAKEMTVSQIAEELHLTPQAIYHHVRKLKDAGLIEIAREERVEHFIETYYSATAEVFHLSHGEGKSRKIEEQQVLEGLQNLPKIGIELKADETVASRLVGIQRRMHALGSKPEWADKVSALEDIDFFGRQTLLEYAGYLSMSDEEFKEYCELNREIRRLLKSKLASAPRAKRKS
jgi:DNA-binding transcriptional ArsR family regulator